MMLRYVSIQFHAGNNLMFLIIFHLKCILSRPFSKFHLKFEMVHGMRLILVREST